MSLSPLNATNATFTTQEVKTPIEEVKVIKTDLPERCLPYLGEIYKYNWDAETAGKIMLAESGCNPEAKNFKDNHGRCLGSYGLMQVSCTTSTTTDPVENIRIAYEEKYLNGGFTRHWGVCKPTKAKDGTVLPPKVDCKGL